MGMCLLCKQREAIKKNSHLVPHFLVKTAINKGGSTLRDYELTYGISENKFIESFFGRNITLDTILDIKGRELTDDEVTQSNPFSRDYILCKECEVNISRIEDYFSVQVYDRLKRGDYGEREVGFDGNTIAIYKKIKPELVFLFAYSIFFRCSIGRYHGFQLPLSIEEEMRLTLLSYLDSDINVVIDRIDNKSFKYFPVVITFFEVDAGDDLTENFVTINHSKIPFFIYLNQITIQLYLKEKHVGSSQELMYKISQYIDFKQSVSSFGMAKFTVLDNNKRRLTLNHAFEYVANSQIRYYIKVFRQVHLAIFGKKPSDAIVGAFIQEFSSNKLPESERYTKEVFGEIMFNVCKRFYNM